MSLAVAIPVMLLLLLLKGLFSGSEIALVNADKIRLKRMARSGHRGAQRVLKAFERPDELLSTTLIGTNISTIALTTIGTLQMVHLLGADGDLWAFLIFTPIFLVLGEIVPKSVFQDKSDLLTPVLIYPLLAVSTLLWPVIFVFSRIARLAARLAGSHEDSGLFMSREQLSEVVKLAETSGSLGTLNKGQLRRVLNFCDTYVSQVMIPLEHVLCFDKHASAGAMVNQCLKTRHYRFPVYENNRSNITGMVIMTSSDMLDPAICERPLEELIRPVLFVTEIQTLDEVLPLIRERADRMAIVVDDVGAATGIVSFEDMLAIAIGNIDIGRGLIDTAHPNLDIDTREDGSVVVDGHMPVMKLNELIGKDVFSTRLNTVNSIILEKTHRIPKTGEVIVSSGFEFTVQEANERTIVRVRFRKIEA